MRKLIFIIGNSGSGKDTAANYLRDKWDCKKVASYTTRPMREGEKQCNEHIFMRWGAVANDPDFWADMHGLHVFAKTYYGGHHYWVTMEQMMSTPSVMMNENRSGRFGNGGKEGRFGNGGKDTAAERRKPEIDRPIEWRERTDNYPTLYIIDEKGLMGVLMDIEKSKWLCNHFDWDVWFVQRHESQLEEAGVSAERMTRDQERKDDRDRLMHILNSVGKMPRIICNYGSLEDLYGELDKIARPWSPA